MLVFWVYVTCAICKLALNEMGLLGRQTGFLLLSNCLLLILLIFHFTIFLDQTCLTTVEASSATLNYTNYRQVSTLRLKRIHRHLDKINRPPVITIQVYMLIHALIFIYNFNIRYIYICLIMISILICRAQMEI